MCPLPAHVLANRWTTANEVNCHNGKQNLNLHRLPECRAAHNASPVAPPANGVALHSLQNIEQHTERDPPGPAPIAHAVRIHYLQHIEHNLQELQRTSHVLRGSQDIAHALQCLQCLQHSFYGFQVTAHTLRYLRYLLSDP